MNTPRAVLIPLVNGDELLVAHRHTGGLLLAQRSGRPGHFRTHVIGAIAAEDVHQLHELLVVGPPAKAPTPSEEVVALASVLRGEEAS